MTSKEALALRPFCYSYSILTCVHTLVQAASRRLPTPTIRPTALLSQISRASDTPLGGSPVPLLVLLPTLLLLLMPVARWLSSCVSRRQSLSTPYTRAANVTTAAADPPLALPVDLWRY